MWIEDDELRIFVDLLSEVYIDNYIQPSIEWTSLPEEMLIPQFERFKKKKCQIEKMLRQNVTITQQHYQIHFWFEPEDNKLTSADEDVFQAMTEFLEVRAVICNCVDLKKAYRALRCMLEDNGCYVPKVIQGIFNKIGISIETSQVSEWDKKHIIIQAVAQVIAYDDGVFNIKKIKSVILSIDYRIKQLMYLDKWESVINYDEGEDGFEGKDRAKSIETHISIVNPIPKGKRRGRPPSQPKILKEVVFIPGIFEDTDEITKINFQKLRIALCYFAVILAYNGRSYDEIKEHPVVLKYICKIPIFLRSLLEVWIAEAVEVYKINS